jgi:hypothetical protein
MNTNKVKVNKVLVPRNRSFSDLLFAADVTEFAELDTITPPSLPVSAFVSTIVAKLEKAGYKHIARSMEEPSSSKTRMFRTWLRDAHLTEEERYALATMNDEDETRWDVGQLFVKLQEVEDEGGVHCYECNLERVVRVNVGLWR